MDEKVGMGHQMKVDQNVFVHTLGHLDNSINSPSMIEIYPEEVDIRIAQTEDTPMADDDEAKIGFFQMNSPTKPHAIDRTGDETPSQGFMSPDGRKSLGAKGGQENVRLSYSRPAHYTKNF